MKPFKKTISEAELIFNEFEATFKSLQKNKASGVDDLSCNIIIDVYEERKNPLFKIFKDNLKIAKVSPVFKSGDTSEVGNNRSVVVYRPVVVVVVVEFLSCNMSHSMGDGIHHSLVTLSCPGSGPGAIETGFQAGTDRIGVSAIPMAVRLYETDLTQ